LIFFLDAVALSGELFVGKNYSHTSVGAGHARDQAIRGHGPLLTGFKFLIQDFENC
jgi:hypothetical protein